MKMSTHFRLFIVSMLVFQATSQYMTMMETDAERDIGQNPFVTPLYNLLLVTMSVSLGVAFNSIVTIWFTVQKQVCDVNVK